MIRYYIMVLPLSFKEFLDFHGYTVTDKKSPTGTLKRRIIDQDGDIYDERELFSEYARFGGMPMPADVGLLDEKDRRKPAVHTIQSYIVALIEAYILYEIKRFDMNDRLSPS